MKTKSIAALLFATALASSAMAADEPTLKVGDHAPKLQNGKYIQGEPVKDFENGKAYIVEFWATWCGPCRVSIPHLNEIHNKYKDKGLVVIGQDCWERDEKLVAPFVEKMGDKMTYRVALDDKTTNEKGKMAETWMAAAGRNGIPSAFLVDTKGIIAWIGHPMTLKDTIIDQVLEGKFDVQKAAADYAAEQKLQVKIAPIWTALNRAVAKKDWAEAEKSLAQAEELIPAEHRDSLEMTRFNIALGKKDYKAAYQVASKISDSNKDNAMLQNELAWRIATDPQITERDLKLADTMAERANTAAKGKDPGILDTVARVKFMLGKKDEAIALQEKAVSLADPSVKATFESTLESYKRGELSKAN